MEPEGPQITSQYGAYALRAGVGKATRTHTTTHPGTRTHAHTHTDKYVILIAFSRLLLRERASVLRYTYIACFIKTDLSVLELIYRDRYPETYRHCEECVHNLAAVFFFRKPK